MYFPSGEHQRHPLNRGLNAKWFLSTHRIFDIVTVASSVLREYWSLKYIFCSYKFFRIRIQSHQSLPPPLYFPNRKVPVIDFDLNWSAGSFGPEVLNGDRLRRAYQIHREASFFSIYDTKIVRNSNVYYCVRWNTIRSCRDLVKRVCRPAKVSLNIRCNGSSYLPVTFKIFCVHSSSSTYPVPSIKLPNNFMGSA